MFHKYIVETMILNEVTLTCLKTKRVKTYIDDILQYMYIFVSYLRYVNEHRWSLPDSRR